MALMELAVIWMGKPRAGSYPSRMSMRPRRLDSRLKCVEKVSVRPPALRSVSWTVIVAGRR